MNSKTDGRRPKTPRQPLPFEELFQPLRDEPCQPLPPSAVRLPKDMEHIIRALVALAQSGAEQHPVAELQLLPSDAGHGQKYSSLSSLCNIAKKAVQPSETNLSACESAIFLSFLACPGTSPAIRSIPAVPSRDSRTETEVIVLLLLLHRLDGDSVKLPDHGRVVQAILQNILAISDRLKIIIASPTR